MSDHKSMLCVGGPRAGQRFAVTRGSGFRVATKTDAPENDPGSPEWQPNKPVGVEFADYREETFHTPQGDVSFWTPMDQTPFEAITILLETYERLFLSPQDWKSLPVLANRIDSILSEAREKKNAGQSFEDVFRFMCAELALVAYGLRDR